MRDVHIQYLDLELRFGRLDLDLFIIIRINNTCKS